MTIALLYTDFCKKYISKNYMVTRELLISWSSKAYVIFTSGKNFCDHSSESEKEAEEQ